MTASTTDTRRYIGSYPAEPVQVRQVRAAFAALLPDCPRADDAILVASEYFFPGFRSVSALCSG